MKRLALVIALLTCPALPAHAAESAACDWLAGPQNCWRSAILEARACVPSGTAVLQPDGSCRWADGTTFRMTRAGNLRAGIQTDGYRVVVERKGQPCFTWEVTDSVAFGPKIPGGRRRFQSVGELVTRTQKAILRELFPSTTGPQPEGPACAGDSFAITCGERDYCGPLPDPRCELGLTPRFFDEVTYVPGARMGLVMSVKGETPVDLRCEAPAPRRAGTKKRGR